MIIPMMEFGAVRFNEMRKYIGGISYKTLSLYFPFSKYHILICALDFLHK